MFGEISYLQSGPVTASVVANEEDTIVYAIEVSLKNTNTNTNKQTNKQYTIKTN